MRTFVSDLWEYPQTFQFQIHLIFQRCYASVAWRRLWQIQDGRLELVSANRNGQHPLAPAALAGGDEVDFFAVFSGFLGSVM